MDVIYKCEYCGKTGTKEQISEHEKCCERLPYIKGWYNPAIRGCLTCANCYKSEPTPSGHFTIACTLTWDGTSISPSVYTGAINCKDYIQGEYKPDKTKKLGECRPDKK